MRTFEKQKLLRRALYALLLVGCALLQHTRGAFLHFGNVHAWLLLVALIPIAMQERSIPALLFGAFAGVLWDYAGVRADGFFAFWFALLAFVCSTLVTFWVRNNFRAAMLFSGGALALTALFHWICFIVIPGEDGALWQLLHFSLPCALFSFVFTPPLYWLVRQTAAVCAKREPAV